MGKKRKEQRRETETSAEDVAPRPAPDPPRGNRLLLAASVAAFSVWFLFLVWLAWRLS
jgi:hypothetical protein